PGYDFVRGNDHPNDDDGHGTHVTGTLAQSTNNNQDVAGIAFNCAIMPVKVLTRRGVGTYTDIADGIYFAADNGADIINMSLGGASDSTTLRNAVAYAYNQTVTIICAAGNEFEHGNLPSYPAAYDDYCIAVGATRYDRTRAYYSNTGSYLDLVAPGGDLNVDQNADGNGDGILQQTFGSNPKDWDLWFYTGTSMAAPHVSGVAALLISTGVTGPDTIRQALEDTAIDLGSSGWDAEYGWGIVDAYAALNYYNVVPGDFTADGMVNSDDLILLMSYWLQDEPSVDIAPEPNGDGIIDLLDFSLFTMYWMDGVGP
ncbi:MAG: S8 family serine peptidase, partial [Planctomycetota bacterium]